MTTITDKPHLFELWWERYMPNATQSEAWEAWMAAPRADGVGVASQQAEPKTCIYPSCQHNGCLPDCEEQAEPSSGSSNQAPGLCSGSSEPSEARVEAAAKALLARRELKLGDLTDKAREHYLEDVRAVLQAADAVSAPSTHQADVSKSAGGIDGWRPIETAPTDRAGPPLSAIVASILDDGSYYVEEAWFDFERGEWWPANVDYGDAHGMAIYPCLWQPLPAAPGSEQKEGANG